MSRNSERKQQRRHKREKKKQRRNYQRWLIARAKAQKFEIRQAELEQNTGLNRQALRPPTNTASHLRNDHVLTPKQGFDLNKWRPNE